MIEVAIFLVDSCKMMFVFRRVELQQMMWDENLADFVAKLWHLNISLFSLQQNTVT